MSLKPTTNNQQPTRDSASLLRDFAQGLTDKPSELDTAAALYIAAEDGVSSQEADILERSFIKQLPIGSLKMDANQLQEAKGAAALGYAGAIRTMSKSEKHHLHSLLKLMMQNSKTPRDALLIAGLIARNPSLLSDALDMAKNLNFFKTPEIQQLVHHSLLQQRGGALIILTRP